MEPSNQPDVPAGLAAGRLEGISLPDLLWAICSRKKTGVLHVAREGVDKTLYIEAGRIVFAASSDPDDRLGELLLRQGLIDLDRLDEALGRLYSGKRLGTLMVEAGHLSPEHLVEGVLSQVERIVLGLFTWESGEYRFDEGALPTEEVITLGMRTGEILLRGIRRIRSFQRIRRSVGPARTCYRLVEGWREALHGLDLGEGEGSLVARLDRGPATVDELCREVLLSNFEVYQTLWAMKVLGAVVPCERPIGRTSGAAEEGQLDERGIAPALVRLCRGGETGVLYVVDASRERTLHLREGRCVFATSNDFEDGLLAHLLRRGVISLQDREETAKRLLSNKRVGTILREMGVIDDVELGAMVREQLAEIVYDTLGWTHGEYTFVAGELPTIEEITLDASVEGLVADGFRRIASWSRVRQGCGGLDARLVLAPAYLEVLDAMEVGPDDWDLVSGLAQPRTVREVCRASELPDFAVCQALWTLRVLGAVEEARIDLEVAETEYAETALETDASEADSVRVTVVDPEPVVDTAAGADTGDEPDTAAEDVAGEDRAEPVAASAVTEWADGEDETETDADADTDADAAAAPSGDEAADDRWEVPVTFEGQPGDSATFIPRSEVEAALAGLPDAPAGAEAHDTTRDDGDLEEAGGAAGGTVGDSDVPRTETTLPGVYSVGDATAVIPRAEIEAALTGGPDVTEAVDEPPADAEQVDAGGDNGRAVDETELHAEPDRAPPAADAGAAEAMDAEPLPRFEHPEDSESVAGQEARSDLAPGDLEGEGGAYDEIEAETFAEEAVAAEPDDDWEPPGGLDEQIRRFNDLQRIVYRTIRAEVGAGAANLVRACTIHSGDRVLDPFVDADMNADGTWDAESLKRAVRQRRLDDPSAEYRRLIDREIDLLRDHIGESRTEALIEQLQSMPAPEARADDHDSRC